jgi:hypothetical protein
MRKTFCLTVFVLAAALNLLAASVSGVTFPDTASVDGKTLSLNGMGVRVKGMFFKVYVAGLYVEQKSNDAAAILKSDQTKRLLMQFTRSVSKEQLNDSLREGLEANAPAALKSMKAEFDQVLGAMGAYNEGEQVSITYTPGKGTTLGVKGKDVLTIPGKEFADAIFSIWLGPKPPTADLKNKLTGR